MSTRRVASDKPVVFEAVTPERCAYWRQVRRQYQYATGNTIIDLDRRRHLAVLAGAAGKLLSGLVSLAAAVLLGAFSARRFRKYALRAGKQMMYAGFR